jgi:hypothetical protein
MSSGISKRNILTLMAFSQGLIVLKIGSMRKRKELKVDFRSKESICQEK